MNIKRIIGIVAFASVPVVAICATATATHAAGIGDSGTGYPDDNQLAACDAQFGQILLFGDTWECQAASNPAPPILSTGIPEGANGDGAAPPLAADRVDAVGHVETTTLREELPCQEDEPCWDCHTMGNLICGTVIGDYGVGTPTEIEVSTCQDVNSGEMIYDPSTNLWTCEAIYDIGTPAYPTEVSDGNNLPNTGLAVWQWLAIGEGVFLLGVVLVAIAKYRESNDR